MILVIKTKTTIETYDILHTGGTDGKEGGCFFVFMFVYSFLFLLVVCNGLGCLHGVVIMTFCFCVLFRLVLVSSFRMCACLKDCLHLLFS